jgi:hypothetical protein
LAYAFQADGVVPYAGDGVLYRLSDVHVLAGAVGEALKLWLPEHGDASSVHFIHFKLLFGAAEIPIVLSVFCSVRELFLNAAALDLEEFFATDFAFFSMLDLGVGLNTESFRVVAQAYVPFMQFTIGSPVVDGAVLLVSLDCLSRSVLADAGFVLLLVSRLRLDVLDAPVYRKLPATYSLRLDRERTGVSRIELDHIRLANNLYQWSRPSLRLRSNFPGFRVPITVSNRRSSIRYLLTHT